MSDHTQPHPFQPDIEDSPFTHHQVMAESVIELLIEKELFSAEELRRADITPRLAARIGAAFFYHSEEGAAVPRSDQSRFSTSSLSEDAPSAQGGGLAEGQISPGAAARGGRSGRGQSSGIAPLHRHKPSDASAWRS